MLSLFRHPGYKKDSNACPAPQFIRPECAVARPGKILIDGATRLIPKCPLLVNCLFVSRQNESHPVHYLRALYVPYVLAAAQSEKIFVRFLRGGHWDCPALNLLLVSTS